MIVDFVVTSRARRRREPPHAEPSVLAVGRIDRAARRRAGYDFEGTAREVPVVSQPRGAARIAGNAPESVAYLARSVYAVETLPVRVDQSWTWESL